MGKRRKSREFALQVLYQIEITQQNSLQAIHQVRENFWPPGDQDEFAQQIILGVMDHRQEIDRLIESHSEHWRLDRISVIDRNILRIAIFELLYCDEIPPKVTLNEAIDLGKRFGSEESGSFINGILDRIQKEVIRKPL